MFVAGDSQLSRNEDLTKIICRNSPAEVVPPDTNRRSSFAGQRLRLGGRKPAGSSCRDEAAALAVLAARHGKQVFTVGEVYVEMLATGTSYAESTVSKTMQRMKEPAARPPYAQLERGATGGFRLLRVRSWRQLEIADSSAPQWPIGGCRSVHH
jgi:hypothetical protein